MESLTKENFWNPLASKYPQAFVHFSEWIDDYKKQANWTVLFGNSMRMISDKISFHDLPFEMQCGVLLRYFKDSGFGNNQFKVSSIMSIDLFKIEVEYCFNVINTNQNI